MDLDNLTDDQLMNLNTLPVEKVETPPSTREENQTPEDPPETEEKSETDGQEEAQPEEQVEDPAEPAPKEETNPLAPDAAAIPAEDPAPTEQDKPETPSPEDVDYKAAYEKIMAPFKANGKEIQLSSPEEVIQLMQMGANYTKKMQAMQQHKKLLMMLENNGLLDEDKISFYIDLEKKNPDAIKKYLKDSSIDPLELDTSGEVTYRSGSHVPTDQEVTFQGTIDELSSTPSGKETLQSLGAWDAVSKSELLKHPEVINVIHTQRENGIYAQVSNEIERRRLLGQIAPGTPFLHAYKIVGDDLMSRGLIQGATPAANPIRQPVAGRTPVAVRPAKSTVTKTVDSSKVRAAAATRTSPTPAKSPVDYGRLSDEDILKLADKV